MPLSWGHSPQTANTTIFASSEDQQLQRRNIADATLVLLESFVAVHEWSEFVIRALRLGTSSFMSR